MRCLTLLLALPLLPLAPGCTGMFSVGGAHLVVGASTTARPDVRMVSQQMHEVHGWRTVRGDDGSSVLVDINLQFVVDSSGRSIRVTEDGALYVVGQHGRQESVDTSDAIAAAGHIEVEVEIALSITAGWRTAVTTGGANVLVDSSAEIVVAEHGEPICVAPSGDLYIDAGGERVAIEADAYASARADFGGEVTVEVFEMAGFRVADAFYAPKVLVNARGELLVDDSGQFVYLDEGGAPFVLAAGIRLDLNLDLPDIAGMLADARIDFDIEVSADVAVAANPANAGVVGDMSAPDRVNTGAPYLGAASANGELSGVTPGAGADSLTGDIHFDVEAQVAVAIPGVGEPGREAEHLGGPNGVSAAGGGRATFNMLVQAEVRVDGFRLGLGDLGPIAPLTAHAQADALETLPEIQVHAGLEHSQLSREGGETNLIVELEGGPAPSEVQTNVRLHLVIDRSSSMQSSWRDVLGAAELLVGELRPSDSVQIVAYGTNVQEVLALQRVGNGRSTISALRRISVGGGTNIEVGLRAAYAAAAAQPLAGNERSLVILLSDGVPNGGAYTADGLAPMARRARETSACTTTVIGLGNQFDPEVLRAIADSGQGSYHIARGAAELAPVLRAELRAQQRIAVRDVEVTLRLAGGVTLLEGGQTDASGNVVLEMPQLREGEHRRMELRVHVQGGSATRSVGQLDVAYRAGNTRASASKALLVAYGDEPQLATAGPAFVIADKDLGRALDLAANAVLNGQASVAAEALNAHVARIEARADFQTHAALRARTVAAGRFAEALATITPRASHSERRVFSLAMGQLASTLLR